MKPQLARESCYLGQNIGQEGEVPTKQNFYSPVLDHSKPLNMGTMNFCGSGCRTGAHIESD